MNGFGCDVKTTNEKVNNEEETPDVTPSTPPSAPTMSCTGLNYTPATTPVIGTKLTFTCTGAVVPATAGVLSYKFRYSINNGTLAPLTNKTANTAELTIAACGTYTVECQACALMNASATGLVGKTICDPIWTGATVQ
jgi:hypothetical protein